MGLRVALFAAAFNLLLWISRLTLGLRGAAFGPACTWTLTLLGPAALAIVAVRALPSRRDALLATAVASLAVASIVAP